MLRSLLNFGCRLAAGGRRDHGGGGEGVGGERLADDHRGIPRAGRLADRDDSLGLQIGLGLARGVGYADHRELRVLRGHGRRVGLRLETGGEEGEKQGDGGETGHWILLEGAAGGDMPQLDATDSILTSFDKSVK